MSISIKGPWTQSQVSQYLGDTRVPLRLACIGADGFPRVVSLWFCYQAGRLYCVSHRDSMVVKLLEKQGKVGFEIAPNEPPYSGVRGQGVATLQPLGDRSTLTDLVDRYLGGQDSSLASWLLSRSEQELLITIEPIRLFTWDYRERMADLG
jgi:hypothetical protein